ncbi:unnamed protein product, partial [Prorocentrum cordatum]
MDLSSPDKEKKHHVGNIGQHIQVLQHAYDTLAKGEDGAEGEAAKALQRKLQALREERDSSKSASQRLLVASGNMSKFEKQVDSHTKTVGMLEVKVQNAAAHLREQERELESAMQSLADAKRKLQEVNTEMAVHKAAVAAASESGSRSSSPKPSPTQIFALTPDELQQMQLMYLSHQSHQQTRFKVLTQDQALREEVQVVEPAVP